MTLVLKDFFKLREQFVDTVSIMVKRDGSDTTGVKDDIHTLPEKIKILDPKRRDEIQFLLSIFQNLEKIIIDTHPKDRKPLSAIIYGAMNVIDKDIEKNLGMFERMDGSVLHTGMDDARGITDTIKPTLLQKVEQQRALNEYLNVLFKEHNSINGINHEHPLSAVPLEKLVTFTLHSYKLEEEAAIAEIAELKTEGKSKPLAKLIMTGQDPADAVNSFGSWLKLTHDLHQAILDELAAKDVATIGALSNKYPVRAAQLSFLETLTDCLDGKAYGLNEQEKIAILAGAMYIVRDRIGLEYKKEAVSFNAIPDSKVHVSLTNILKPKEEPYENIELMISKANQFIRHMTIEYVPNQDNNVIREKHMFSNFALSTILNVAQSMIQTCRLRAFERCVSNYAKELEAAPSTSQPTQAKQSYLSLGSFASWFKKAPEVTAPVDYDVTLNTDPTAPSSSNQPCSSSSSI